MKRGSTPIAFMILIVIIFALALFLKNKTDTTTPTHTNPETSSPSPTHKSTKILNVPDPCKKEDVALTSNWPSATTEEKSTWKTYVDKENGFSIMYPKEWTEGKWGESSIAIAPEITGWREKGLYLVVLPDGGTPSSLAYYTKREKDFLGGDYGDDALATCYFKEKPLYFSSFDATISYGIVGANNPGPYVDIKKGNKILELQTEFESDEKDIKGEFVLFSKIFSTFKFTP